MQRIINTEGARYELSSQWDSENKSVRVDLKIDARDWKKPSDLEIISAENNFPFILNIFKILGYEEEWPCEKGVEIDYSSVQLVLTAKSSTGKELYRDTIDSSGKFYHDITFYIKPEIGNF